MKVRFYVNEGKPRAASACAALAASAARAGLDVVADAAADVVLALGGDGTILRCVHEFGGVPVLGFNLGGLGYLSGVEERDFGRALASLAAGRYAVAERTMLRLGSRVALNDVVLQREMSGHAAVLDLSVDGRAAARYTGDGLVIATPTGSTAYSLAAGGPVLMPDSASFAVTPMNPHALGIRPIVVSDAVRLAVTSRPREGRAEKIGVYADGEWVRELADGETVEIDRAPASARFVELEGYDPYAVLAHKLGWSGSGGR